jgi:hypothetical protein
MLPNIKNRFSSSFIDNNQCSEKKSVHYKKFIADPLIDL